MAPKTTPETAFAVRLVPLADLTPNPANARKHPADQIEAIEASMLEFGWTNPILADLADDGMIVAGHGRREAIKGLHTNGAGVTLPNRQTLPSGMVLMSPS